MWTVDLKQCSYLRSLCLYPHISHTSCDLCTRRSNPGSSSDIALRRGVNAGDAERNHSRVPPPPRTGILLTGSGGASSLWINPTDLNPRGVVISALYNPWRCVRNAHCWLIHCVLDQKSRRQTRRNGRSISPDAIREHLKCDGRLRPRLLSFFTQSASVCQLFSSSDLLDTSCCP